MRKTTANIGLPQWGLTCFYDSLVLNPSAVLRLNFSAKIPHCGKPKNVMPHFNETPRNINEQRKFLENYD